MKELSLPNIEERIGALVDGCLDEASQIALLTEIENEAPQTWRNVALAYIEADLLRGAFREEEAGTEEPLPEIENKKKAVKMTLFATAAALLIGFFLGNLFQSPPSPPSPTNLVESSPSTPTPTDAAKEKSIESGGEFQTIRSLDTALRSRGIEPTISTAVYQTELPDGRRLYLPMQTLSLSH